MAKVRIISPPPFALLKGRVNFKRNVCKRLTFRKVNLVERRIDAGSCYLKGVVRSYVGKLLARLGVYGEALKESKNITSGNFLSQNVITARNILRVRCRELC